MLRPKESIFLFQSPYAQLEPIGARWRPTRSPERGMFLIWKNMKTPPESGTIAYLSERDDSVDLVVVLPPPEDYSGVKTIMGVLSRVRPSYVLPNSIDSIRRIRQLVRQPPASLPNQVILHLSERGLITDERTYDELLQLFREAETVRTITALAKRMATSRRTLGRHFAAAGIPSPSHWLQFARLLGVLVRLQRTDLPLARAAVNLGYPDPFTCSNQMKRLVGIRPSEAKRCFGWKWFVECWVKQEALRGGFDVPRYYEALARYLPDDKQSPGAIQ